ncbi:peptidoglycan DD-metalloendopeptidase family protein [Rhodobacterales bacterium]|nr:peptidoglycan DD-metalloendopeptidase family protein [Rhodobacterales bacterium]
MKKRMRTLRGDLLGKVGTISMVAVFLASCSSAVERFGEPPFYTGNTQNQREILASGNGQPTYQDIANGPGGTTAGLPRSSSEPVTTGSISGSRGSIQSAPLPAPVQTGSASSAPTGGRNTQVSTLPAPEAARTASVSQGRDWKGWTSAGSTRVQVRQGDTLGSVARRYGVPIEALASVNGIENAGSVRPGQSLVIPTYVYAENNASTSVTAGESGNVKLPSSGSNGSVVTGSIPGSSGGLPRPDRKPGETSTADKPISVASVDALPKRKPAGSHGRTVTTASVSPSADPSQTKPTAGRTGQTSSGSVKTSSLPAPALTKEAAPTEPIKPATSVASVRQDEDVSTELFRWPVRGRIISEFGAKPGGGKNEGVNLAVPEGTAIKAADDGTVIYSGNELKGYGNLILVRHNEGWVTAYAHNSELKVKRGDTVRRGDVVALAGATGSVSQPQLHFEVRKGNKPVDPLKYLPKR